MSNCMMSKTRAITKICRCVEVTDTLNTCGKKFIMITVMVCYYEIFTSCQGSMRTFSKHYSKCKTVSRKVQKNIAREETANIKFFTGKPTKQVFLDFLTSKNIFITLQYSGDIPGIFLKQTFVECFSIIPETLLCDYWNLLKDQHLLLPNHTLLTQKQLFHRKLFKKSFPLKCSLNVP